MFGCSLALLVACGSGPLSQGPAPAAAGAACPDPIVALTVTPELATWSCAPPATHEAMTDAGLLRWTDVPVDACGHARLFVTVRACSSRPVTLGRVVAYDETGGALDVVEPEGRPLSLADPTQRVELLVRPASRATAVRVVAELVADAPSSGPDRIERAAYARVALAP